ncbi:hypothetical protein, partial [Mycobacterium paragordonae]
IVIDPFTIPALDLVNPNGGGNSITGTIGPLRTDPITILGPSLSLLVGGPGQGLHLSFSGPGLGPLVVPV